MRRQRKNNIKLLLLILLLSIGIGYAAMNTALKINGTVDVAKANWDVHFENVSITQGSVTANPAPTTNNTDTTEMTYTINFTKPGDFYEFTVDIVNNGTIDAMIEDVSNKVYQANGTTEIQLPSYLTSTLTYIDNFPIAQNHILPKKNGNTKTIETVKIRIEFKKDIQVSDLPSSGDTTIKFKFIGKYKQADENAINRNTCEVKMPIILANQDKFRNKDQDSNNLDIGLDNNCNVINLDMWIGENEDNNKEKLYYTQNMLPITANYDSNVPNDEIYLGFQGGYYSPATSSANIINGEIQTPIPAYILINGESDFYPVTNLSFLFGNNSSKDVEKITVMPEIPDTIEVIGCCAFCYQGITGNIILPQTVESIGGAAFLSNNLTSVTFPSTTTFYENLGFGNSFDDGVIINHTY